MNLVRVALKRSCLSRKLTFSLIYPAFAYQLFSCFLKHLTAVVLPDALELWVCSWHLSSYLKALTLLILEDCLNSNILLLFR